MSLRDRVKRAQRAMSGMPCPRCGGLGPSPRPVFLGPDDPEPKGRARCAFCNAATVTIRFGGVIEGIRLACGDRESSAGAGK